MADIEDVTPVVSTPLLGESKEDSVDGDEGASGHARHLRLGTLERKRRRSSKRVFTLTNHMNLVPLDELKALISSSNVDDLDALGNSYLHYAARYDMEDIVGYMLSLGADVNVCGKDELTPLHIASRFNSVQVLGLLLKSGADVTARNIHGASALHLSAMRGHLPVIKELLKNSHVTLYDVDITGSTPLHHACAHGHLAVCRFLIDEGEDGLSKCDNDGRIPLHLAAAAGHEDVLKFLLTTASKLKSLTIKQYINEEDIQRQTSLHLAALNGHERACAVLLDKGASMISYDERTSPLHLACLSGHNDVVKLLVLRGADINDRDHDNNTPLHMAAMFNHKSVLDMLLERGAEVDTKSRVQMMTPFLCAVKKSHIDIARVLIDKGAKLNEVDSYGKNSLHIAVENNDLPMVKFLFEESEEKDWECGDKQDQFPLHFAAAFGRIQILELLLKSSADLFPRDCNEATPLHLAAKNGHLQCVQLLSSAGPCHINSGDAARKTPLHLAAESGRRKVCQQLVDLGAQVNMKDEHNLTPLHFASHKGALKTVCVLLDNGADCNAEDKDSNTALHLAASEGQKDIVIYLLDKEADVKIRNKKGKTVLDLAIQHDEETAMSMLKHCRWQEIMNIRDNNNRTPMKKLIAELPQGAQTIMDQSIIRSEHFKTDPDYTVTYNLRFLDPPPNDRVKFKDRFFGPETMMQSKRESLLTHPLTRVLLSYKWAKYGRILFLFNLLTYVIFLALFSEFIVARRDAVYFRKRVGNKSAFISDINTFGKQRFIHRSTPLYLTIFVVLHMIKELIQMGTLGLKYFTQISNLLDWMLYISCLVYLAPYNRWGLTGALQGSESAWLAGVLAILLSWLNLCLFLQRFRSVGLYVRMIVDVVKTVMKVAMIFAVIMLGFAFVFYILLKEQESFRDLPKTIMKVFVMSTGEIDYSSIIIDHLGLVNPVTGVRYIPFYQTTQLFLVLFIFIMPIIVNNLLIGLAVGDIDSIRKNAKLETLSLEIEFLDDIESVYPMIVTRYFYTPEIIVKPNVRRQSGWKTRLTNIIRFGLNTGTLKKSLVDSSEPDSDEMKQDILVEDLKKTKQKVKEIANIVKQQRTILDALARKFDINTSVQVVEEAEIDVFET